MKFLVLVVCLPMALAAQSVQNRALGAHFSSLFGMGAMKTHRRSPVGDDFTELCQRLCERMRRPFNQVLDCTSICHSKQKSTFRRSTQHNGAMVRRSLDDFVDDSMRTGLYMLLGVLDSDSTEEMCEQEVLKLVNDGIYFNPAIPSICRSLQIVLRMFNITWDTTTFAP